MTQGIISNTIVINLGDSLSNINEVKKGLKDVQAALKIMEKEQGRSAMVNGTLMDAKELRGVIQKLQSDMKAMQGTSSVKSKATKGIDDAVVETKKQLQTLQAKVRETMTAADKAWQTNNGFSGARRNFNEALNQLVSFKKELGTLSIGQEKGIYTGLRRRLDEDSASAKVLTERIKELNAETARNKARDSVVNPKVESIGSAQITNGIKEAKQAILAIDRQIFEQLQKNNGVETQRTQELRRQKAELESQVAVVKTPKTNTEHYITLQREIKKTADETERLWRIQNKPNATKDQVKAYTDAQASLKLLIAEQEKYNKAIGNSHGLIDGMGRRIRSHLEWIVSGGLITAFAALPSMIENIARETEVLGQKLKQNLELAERYRDNHHGLEEDVRHLGDVAATFAVGYGANVKDVLQMMQVLSRRFKSPEELTYYTNLAMVMHKLDFVAPTKAAEDLEAVILSMGLDFHGAKRFIDEFSVAVNCCRLVQ